MNRRIIRRNAAPYNRLGNCTHLAGWRFCDLKPPPQQADVMDAMGHIQPKLAAPSKAKSGPDRRRSGRTPDASVAFIHSPTSSCAAERIAIAGLNVSKHGLAFSVDQPLAVGAYFMLDLPSGQTTREREILILHCQPLDGGRFGVGAEFA